MKPSSLRFVLEWSLGTRRVSPKLLHGPLLVIITLLVVIITLDSCLGILMNTFCSSICILRKSSAGLCLCPSLVGAGIPGH